MRHIHIGGVEGKPAVCFETGLDPNSFARTKMSQSLTEPGFIVFPDGSHDMWKPSGVNEFDGLMRIWGPSFSGERLDLLINEAISSGQDSSRQEALQAVVFWIRTKLLLGETPSALSPGAAFVSCTDNPEHPKGSVFFAPENLSQRCLFIEGAEPNYYYCPDLKNMEAAAFCAGAMLYRILAKTHPYPAIASVFQDMREGAFMPLNFAVPGLDEKLCGLIHSALLLPVKERESNENGTDILGDLLTMLMNKEGNVVSISTLFRELTEEENALLEKEKKYYLKVKSVIIKANRFITQNKTLLMVVAAALIFAIFITAGMIKNRFERPTTAGLNSEAVVSAYYEAFSSLDHVFMEACLMGSVDKSDINVTLNLFVIDKVRQSYEFKVESSIIPAETWKRQGGELPAPDVFGVTDLYVKRLGGSEEEGQIHYRADYLLWIPNEPVASIRSDELTLRRDKRKNWRITEINRTAN